MMKLWKRGLSLLLVLAMCVGMLPTIALTAGAEEPGLTLTNTIYLYTVENAQTFYPLFPGSGTTSFSCTRTQSGNYSINVDGGIYGSGNLSAAQKIYFEQNFQLFGQCTYTDTYGTHTEKHNSSLISKASNYFDHYVYKVSGTASDLYLITYNDGTQAAMKGGTVFSSTQLASATKYATVEKTVVFLDANGIATNSRVVSDTEFASPAAMLAYAPTVASNGVTPLTAASWTDVSADFTGLINTKVYQATYPVGKISVTAPHAIVTGIDLNQSYAAEEQIHFQVSAAQGYTVKSVSFDATAITGDASGNYTGTVKTPADGIAITVTTEADPTYAVSVDADSRVTTSLTAGTKANGIYSFNAYAPEGYTLTVMQDATVLPGNNGTYSYMVNGAATKITMTLTAKNYQVDFASDPTGIGYTVASQTNQPYGTQLTLNNSYIRTITGYTFAGYWTDANGGYYESNDVYTITGNATLTAHYTQNTAQMYTVKFYVDGKLVNAQTGIDGTALEEPAYTLPEGKEWATQWNVTFPATITEDHSYTATTRDIPDAPTYALSVSGADNANLSVTGLTAGNYAPGAAINFSAAANEGYTLKVETSVDGAAYTELTGTNGYYAYTMPAKPVTIKLSATAVAVNTYHVYAKAAGVASGTGVSAAFATANPGVAMLRNLSLSSTSASIAQDLGATDKLPAGTTVILPEPTATGYTFGYWSDSKSTHYAAGETYTVGEADDTLTANFTANSYTVKFYVDDVLKDVQQVAYQQKATTPTYTLPTGREWNVQWPENPTITQNESYYATTKAIQTHTITYMVSGLTAFVQDVAGSTATSISVPAALMPEGQTFAGWKLDEHTSYAANTAINNITTDLTLTATFKPTQLNYVVNNVAGTADYGATITLPNAVAPDGMTFVCYKGSDGLYYTDHATLTRNNMTFTPVYKSAQEYVIVFEADGQLVKVFTGAAGDEVIAPAIPAVDGKTAPAQWANAGGDIDAGDTITIQANATYTASYTLKQSTIHFTSATAGYATIAPVTNAYGTSITLDAADYAPAIAGYHFISWTDGKGGYYEDGDTYTFAGDDTLTAHYAEDNTYTVWFYVDGKFVEAQNGKSGTAITAPAYTLPTGYAWANAWAYPATITADAIYTATTKVATYEISTATEHCTITPVAGTQVAYGNTVKIYVTPEANYALDYITVSDGTNNYLVNHMITGSGNGYYVFTMPAANVTIKAVAVKSLYNITADRTKVNVQNTANTGDTVTFGINEPNQAITQVQVNGGAVKVTQNVDGTYSFTMPAADAAITYTAEAAQYTVSYVVNGLTVASFGANTGDTFDAIACPADYVPANREFVAWSNGPALVTPGTTLTVGTSDLVLSAEINNTDNFVQPTYTVNVDYANETAGSTTTTDVLAGGFVHLDAPTYVGHTFLYWRDTDGNTAMAGTNYYPYEDTTLKAVYTTNQYVARFFVDGTMVNVVPGSYGDVIGAIGYTAPDGYTVSDFKNNSGTTFSDTTTFSTDNNYYATLTATDYTVTVNAITGADVTADLNTANAGDVVTLSAQVAAGYQLTGITYSYGGKVFAPVVNADGTYSFIMPAQDVDVDYTVAAADYTVIYQVGYTTVTTVGAAAGQELTALACPSYLIPAGKAFDYWESNGAHYAVGVKVPVTGNMTLTAHFVNETYDVVLRNGQTNTDISTTTDIAYNGQITLQAPAVENYTFTHWSDAQGNCYDNGTYTVTGDITLTANYVRNSGYVAKFYLDNVLVDVKNGSYGDAISAPVYTVPDGYLAVAPTDFETADGTAYAPTATFKEKEISYYATTTAIAYAVNVTAGDNGTVAVSGTKEAGQTITLTPSNVENGYTIASVTATTVVGHNNLTVLKNADGTYSFTMPAADVAVNVTTQASARSVTFLANGQIVGVLHSISGGSVVAPACPETALLPGTQFDYWYMAGDTTHYVAKDNIPVGTSDMTLYAQTSNVVYQVEIDDANGNVNDTTATYNQAVRLPVPTAPEGKRFAYYLGSDGKQYAAGDVTITGDMTFTAQYTASSYVLQFLDENGKVVEIKTADYNTKITTPAIPAKDGYAAVSWAYGAQTIAGNATYTVVGDATFTATYRANTSAISTKVIVDNAENAASGVVVAANTAANTNDVVTYTVTVPNSYKLQGVTAVSNGKAIANGQKDATIGATGTSYTYQFTMPSAAVGITVYCETIVDKTLVKFQDPDSSLIYNVQYLAKGEAIVAPAAPTKTGYTFAGWFSDKDLKNAFDFATKPNGEKEIPVYAKFTADTYTVQFVEDGGTALLPNQTLGFGDTIWLPTPTKEDYTFLYWKTVDATTATTGRYVGNSQYTVTADVNFIAVWEKTEPDNVTIRFFDDGKIVGVYYVPGGSSIEVPTKPSKEGYTFDCWQDANGNAKIDPEYAGNTTYTYTTGVQDQDFNATWTVNSHTVTFMDEHNNTSNSTQNYGQAVTLPTPTAVGYTFLGWQCSADSRIYLGGGTYTMIDNNVTFTAMWKENSTQVLVKFVDETGLVYSYDLVDVNNDSITFNTPAQPTWKEGYTFNGWKNGQTTVKETASVTLTANKNASGEYDPVVYVADWKINTYGLTVYRDNADAEIQVAGNVTTNFTAIEAGTKVRVYPTANANYAMGCVYYVVTSATGVTSVVDLPAQTDVSGKTYYEFDMPRTNAALHIVAVQNQFNVKTDTTDAGIKNIFVGSELTPSVNTAATMTAGAFGYATIVAQTGYNITMVSAMQPDGTPVAMYYDHDDANGNPVYKFVMPKADVTIKATGAKNVQTVQVLSSSGVVAGTIQVAYGEKVSAEELAAFAANDAQAVNGYSFSKWEIQSPDPQNNSGLEVFNSNINVTTNYIIKAIFTPDEFTITNAADTSTNLDSLWVGTSSANKTYFVGQGAETQLKAGTDSAVTIAVTPKKEYTVSAIQVRNTLRPSEGVSYSIGKEQIDKATGTTTYYYTFNMPAKDVEIYVETAPKTYNLSVEQYVDGVRDNRAGSFSMDGVVTDNKDVAVDTSIEIKAQAADGYQIDSYDILYTDGSVKTNVKVAGSNCIANVVMAANIKTLRLNYSKLSYNIVKNPLISHGTITALETAQVGQEVTITAVADTGYGLKANYPTVTTASGKTVAVTPYGDQYVFTMPAENVTINAIFIEGQFEVVGETDIAGATISVGESGNRDTFATSSTASFKIKPVDGYKVKEIELKTASGATLYQASYSKYNESNKYDNATQTGFVFVYKDQAMTAGNYVGVGQDSTVTGYFKMPNQKVYIYVTMEKIDYSISITQPTDAAGDSQAAISAVDITASSGNITDTFKNAKAGDIVNVTLVAKQGYDFDHCTVTNTTSGAYIETRNVYTDAHGVTSLQFTMPAGNVSIDAVYNYTIYEITGEKNNHGTIYASSESQGNITFAPYKSTVNFTVQADAGYKITGILVNDGKVPYTVLSSTADSQKTCSFTMPNEPVRITATYEAIEYRVTTGTMKNGSIQLDPDNILGSLVGTTPFPYDVATDAVAKFQVKPVSGYEIDQVLAYYTDANGKKQFIDLTKDAETAASDISGTVYTDYTFTMPAYNVEVVATFKEKTYDVTTSITGSGYAQINGYYTELMGSKFGSTVTVKVTPNEGYQIQNVTAETASGQTVTLKEVTSGVYQFTQPYEDVSIAIDFAVKNYRITYTVGDNGAANGPSNNDYLAATSFTVTPDAGYAISNVTATYVSDQTGKTLPVAFSQTPSDLAVGGTYQFTMPKGDVTVKVEFAARAVYSVTANVTGSGTVLFNGHNTQLLGSTMASTVNVSVTPDKGYEIDSVSAKTQSGADVVLTGSDGVYQFTQPAENVIVDVVFVKQETPVDPNPDNPNSNVTISTGATAADVTAVDSAKFGDTVYVTVDPDDGYRSTGITVSYTNKEGVVAYQATSYVSGDEYYKIVYAFTMPECKEGTTVQVTANTHQWASSQYADVRTDKWFYTAVNYCSDRGYFQGYSSDVFAPYDNMTRAMFVTVLGRIAHVDTSKYTGSTFNDVPANAYYAPYVQWAAENGVVTGFNPTTFKPEEYITRQQMCAIMYRYADLIGEDVSFRRTDWEERYTDSDQVTEYAQDAMSWCVAVGIVNGTSPTTLDPMLFANRATVAQIIKNFCDKVLFQ